MYNPRILFICRRRVVTGPSVGLINSALFVSNNLNKNGIAAKVVVVVDANDIDREVYHFKPTHVMLEAIWVPPYKLKELLCIPRYKNVKWIIRIHSKTSFLAMEGHAFEWIREYLDIQDERLIISANNHIFYKELLGVYGNRILYLPNIYQPSEGVQAIKRTESKETIDIGCFGAIRPLKNQLVQGIASMIFADRIGKKLRFHVNGSRIEQNGEQIVKNLRSVFSVSKHELVEHPWMSHSDFVKVLQQMDLGVQVSFSESFNVVVADMIEAAVPLVVSHEIDWIPRIYRANSTNAFKIARAMQIAYLGKKFGLHRLNNWALQWSNYQASRQWIGYLKNL